MTLAQMIARLTRGYIKETGRQPVGLDKLRIKMEAAEKLRQMNKVIQFPQQRSFKQEIESMINDGTIKMGGVTKQSDKVRTRNMFKDSNLNKPKPVKTEAELKAEMEASNKKSIQNLKDKMKDNPEDMADGGVAGLLGERTGFKGGGMDAKDFGKSKSSKKGRTDAQSQYGGTKGYQSSKNKSGRTTTTSGQGGGSGYTNTGGGGGGGPPGTNTGGGTTTTPTLNRGFLSDVRKINQQRYLNLLKTMKPDDFSTDSILDDTTGLSDEDLNFLSRYGAGKVFKDLSKTNIENFMDITDGVAPKVKDLEMDVDRPREYDFAELGKTPLDDLALGAGASKVGKGLYSILKPKPDKPGFNFGVDDFDILNPGKTDIYGNYFNKNFLKDSDYKIGVRQNVKEAAEGDINPQFELERNFRNKTIKGTLDKEGNLNLKFSMPFGNQPPGKVGPRNFKNRLTNDISKFNFGDMTGIPSQAPTNMLMADALTTPTEGKLGLNLTDYSTLKNVGYSDGQIEELQLNPQIDTQEVIRDIKGPIFAGADGGPARQNFKMGKRAFLKAMLGTGAGIAGLKSGLFGMGGKEATKKAVTETVKSAGSGTPPPYFFRLVEKIKFMGDDALATQDKAIAKKYKDYTMEEDFAGNIEIIKKGDNVAEDVYISYKVDEVPLRGKKGSKRVEEYEEYTARPDAEGKMKDIEQGVPDEVIDEAGDTTAMTLKRSSGGIARMLGE
jgi:hypothetical protein